LTFANKSLEILHHRLITASGGKIFCVGREKVLRADADMKVG